MSSKHRQGLPRKRPVNKRNKAIAEEMPVLKPADAAASDGPVKVACVDCDEDGIDTLLTLAVPEMEKKAVAAAITAPLENAAEEHAAAMRFRAVAVRFDGEALIGSAIKDLVAEKLAPRKPVKIIVRRGYGDEVVHESEPPTLEVATDVSGDETTVNVGTGDLAADDLPALFAPFLADIAGGASGKKLVFKFAGNAKPDRELRDHISSTLDAAGARRVAVGARVLFDHELSDRCQVADDGDAVLVTIDPAGDPAITGEAMESVLPDHALALAGRVVRVQWKHGPDHGEGEHLLRIVTGFAPDHVVFQGVDGAAVVVWPPLLDVAVGQETVVSVRPNGRDHSSVLAVFPEEADACEAQLEGKAVVVDWPKLFVIDDDAERCLIDTMTRVGADSVCCTVAGDNREPFLPAPVTLNDTDGHCQIGVNTDAGKPAELVRAVERAMPRFAGHLGGKTVRVVVSGEAAASRTLLRTVLDRVVDAGPARLEVEDHGPVDIMLPPMLVVQRDGGAQVRIEADLGGRDEAQWELALKREFEAAELPKAAVVTLVSSPLDEALLALLIEHQAESVTTDAGSQLYPEVLPEPEPEPEPVAEAEVPPLPAPEPAPATEAPAGAAAPAPAAVAAAGAIRVLAQNGEAVPPTVMLAIDGDDSDAARIAAVQQELQEHLPRLQRRAVMLVLQRNGQDLPVRKPGAMLQMLQATLASGAAASLIFRGPDAQGRPHFQVVHSTLRAMPVGATFRDPRAQA